MTANARGVISESTGLLQALLGLPINLGQILEGLAIDVLRAQAGLFGVIPEPRGREVALNAMRDHTALGREMC